MFWHRGTYKHTLLHTYVYICLSFNPYMDEIRPFLGICDDKDMWYDMSVEFTERMCQARSHNKTFKPIFSLFGPRFVRASVDTNMKSKICDFFVLLKT